MKHDEYRDPIEVRIEPREQCRQRLWAAGRGANDDRGRSACRETPYRKAVLGFRTFNFISAGSGPNNRQLNHDSTSTVVHAAKELELRKVDQTSLGSDEADLFQL
jgi:hypothetical protein